MALAAIVVDHDPIIMPADGAAYVLVRVLSAHRWGGPEWTGALQIDLDAAFHVWKRQVAPSIELGANWVSGPGSHRNPVSAGGGAWLLAITPPPRQPWVALRFRLDVDDGPSMTAIATWSSRDRSNPDARRLVSRLITQTQLVDSLSGLVKAMQQGDAAAGQAHFRATWDLARRVGRADVITDLDRFGNRPGLARAQALLVLAMRSDVDLDLAP